MGARERPCAVAARTSPDCCTGTDRANSDRHYGCGCTDAARYGLLPSERWSGLGIDPGLRSNAALCRTLRSGGRALDA